MSTAKLKGVATSEDRFLCCVTMRGWGGEDGQESWRDSSQLLAVLLAARQKLTLRFSFVQSGEKKMQIFQGKTDVAF